MTVGGSGAVRVLARENRKAQELLARAAGQVRAGVQTACPQVSRVEARAIHTELDGLARVGWVESGITGIGAGV
jgi:hypothetical protein